MAAGDLKNLSFVDQDGRTLKTKELFFGLDSVSHLYWVGNDLEPKLVWQRDHVDPSENSYHTILKNNLNDNLELVLSKFRLNTAVTATDIAILLNTKLDQNPWGFSVGIFEDDGNGGFNKLFWEANGSSLCDQEPVTVRVGENETSAYKLHKTGFSFSLGANKDYYLFFDRLYNTTDAIRYANDTGSAGYYFAKLVSSSGSWFIESSNSLPASVFESITLYPDKVYMEINGEIV